jgi:hypothetical protein
VSLESQLTCFALPHLRVVYGAWGILLIIFVVFDLAWLCWKSSRGQSSPIVSANSPPQPTAPPEPKSLEVCQPAGL